MREKETAEGENEKKRGWRILSRGESQSVWEMSDKLTLNELMKRAVCKCSAAR